MPAGCCLYSALGPPWGVPNPSCSVTSSCRSLTRVPGNQPARRTYCNSKIRSVRSIPKNSGAAGEVRNACSRVGQIAQQRKPKTEQRNGERYHRNVSPIEMRPDRPPDRDRGTYQRRPDPLGLPLAIIQSRPCSPPRRVTLARDHCERIMIYDHLSPRPSHSKTG